MSRVSSQTEPGLCQPDRRNFTIQIYLKENEMMAKKRILSWLVAASLALSLLPAAALAARRRYPAPLRAADP